MIVNLINTILIACGMAVNTTNFNSVEKRPRKNALQTINETLTFQQTNGYEYMTSQNNSNFHNIDIRSYVLNNGQDLNYIYYNDVASIVNTTYVYLDRAINQQESFTETFSFYKIVNYYNANLRFTLDTTTTLNTAPHASYWSMQTYKYTDGNDIDKYINLTLNDSTKNQINGIFQDTTKTLLTSGSGRVPQNDTTFQIQSETTNIEMAPHDVIGIVIHHQVYNQQTNSMLNIMQLNNFKIKGSVLVPDKQPDNIIDVPGMMFTIITLPFSFISQAFNLTIFPNTPYQINFSNLFRTLIAIFVLLWLIKKVFKK